MEDTPVAPTGAETAPASVASTNSNTTAPSSPSGENAPAPSPEITAEQVAKYLGTTPESLEKAKKFYENSGGFDKVFAERKKEISTPQTQIQQAAQLNEAATQGVPAAVQPQPEPYQVPEGFRTQAEQMALAYRNELASAYPALADSINKGEFIKELEAMGAVVMDKQGNFNDRAIRKYLDLKAQTVPAPAAENPVTPTPTVDYVNVGETIVNANQAMTILAQNRELVAMGRAEHPMAKQAQEFIDTVLKTNSSRGKRAHTTLEPKQ